MAVDINGKRWYRHPVRHNRMPVYRSVTSVVSALPKEAIPRWAALKVAEYAVSYMDNWVGLPAMDAVNLLKRVPWDQRDRAAARGSEIHAVMENIVAGKTYEVEAAVEPWIDSAQKLHAEIGLVPEMTEATIYNEKHLFAGTLDFLGRLRAFPELGRCLIDYKTGRGLYEDMGVQVVGAYALGAEYRLDADGTEHEWKPPDSCLLVHLTDKGYKLRPLPMHVGYRRAFLAALEVRKWEADGPKMSGPLERRSVRFDELPGEEPLMLVWLQKHVGMMTLEQKLEVSLHFRELGIPTKPSQMTGAHIEQACALVKLYLMKETPK